MTTCDAIQERLAEEGLEGLRGDAEALSHLEGCVHCTRSAVQAERAGPGLRCDAPTRRPPMPWWTAPWPPCAAPSAVVSGSSWATDRRRVLAGALAASVVLVAGFGVMRTTGILRA